MEQLEKGKLYLPYADETYFSDVIFDKEYEFGVTMQTIDADGNEISESKRVSVTWPKPAVEVSCHQVDGFSDLSQKEYYDCAILLSDDQQTFMAENTIIKWEISPSSSAKFIVVEGSSASLSIEKSSASKLYTVYAFVYHLSQNEITAMGATSIGDESGRRLEAVFPELFEKSVSGFKNLERLTAKSIAEKAEQLEHDLQSSAMIKSTLEEINKLNEEANERGIDIEPLL